MNVLLKSSSWAFKSQSLNTEGELKGLLIIEKAGESGLAHVLLPRFTNNDCCADTSILQKLQRNIIDKKCSTCFFFIWKG